MRVRNRRPLVVASLLAGLAILVTGCSGETKQRASGNAPIAPFAGSLPPNVKAPKSLTISLSGGLQASNAAFFAAEAGPLHDVVTKAGVQLKTVNSESGSQAMASLVGGSADICVCGTNRALAATAAGERLVGIFTPSLGNGTVVVGAKKYEATLGTNVAGYADKTWGYASTGGTNAVGAQALAESAGLTWSKTKQLAYGDIGAAIPTLQSGQAQLLAMDPAAAAKAVTVGVGYVVANLLDPQTMRKVTGDQYATAMWVRPGFLSDHPDFAQAVVTSFVQSLAALQKSSSAQALAMMPKDFKAANNDPAAWDQLWRLVQPAIAGSDGGFHPSVIESTLKSSKAAGAIKDSTPALRAVFDDALVLKAYTQLGVARPSGS